MSDKNLKEFAKEVKKLAGIYELDSLEEVNRSLVLFFNEKPVKRAFSKIEKVEKKEVCIINPEEQGCKS